MLKVLVRVAGTNEVKTVRYDTATLQILDGNLVIYEPNGKYITAGIAKGQWLAFDIVEVDDGG
ncbi:hypothetical protein [Corynebacterium wankanglinii]|uniref:Uncharacterized protein n=1 Tax=Corynebacterium wankanglinii TaxID=2735136 RepID=A0A838CH05_9CORY|nr:hypothetical protein [Corynebacterium wankanglinii]MBA1834162.1 hypothetical protein [Corynebacterium wankanglinii]